MLYIRRAIRTAIPTHTVSRMPKKKPKYEAPRMQLGSAVAPPAPGPEKEWTILRFEEKKWCPEKEAWKYRVGWKGCGKQEDTWFYKDDLTVGSGGYKACLSENAFKMFWNRLHDIDTASDSSASDGDAPTDKEKQRAAQGQ